MKRFITLLALLVIGLVSYSQTTCTIVDPDGNPGTSTTVNFAGTPARCSQTGLAPQSGNKIVVPVGVNLTIENGGAIPTTTTAFHIGNIEVFGKLTNDKAQSQLDGSIAIKNGGTVVLNKIFYIGDSGDSPCPYNLTIESGGVLDLAGGGAADRLVICGNIIAQSSGGCNPYPAGPIPYCEPSGGFAGPIVLNETGLPIELLFFKGSKGLNNVNLNWATASELNFDYFDVEKSADGSNFYSISKVVGHGTTSTRQDYSFYDEKPLNGKNYYRLKSVDFDGYTEYFNVIMVDFDGKKSFSVYPNPSNGIELKAETNFVPNQNAFVTIFSTTGAEIAKFKISGDVSTLTLPVKLESGWYYAKFISSDFTSVSRVLVK